MEITVRISLKELVSMSNLEDYFSEDMTDEERLSNYKAFANGTISGIDFLVKRLSSYYDLLELELDDNPAAEIYLGDCYKSIEQIKRFVDSHQTVFKDRNELESLDLSILLQGITDRLEKVGHSSLGLTNNCEDQSFVMGQFYQLQNAFFELVRCVEGDSLSISLSASFIDGDYFESRNSSLKEGEYYIITFKNVEEAVNIDEEICYNEYLVANNSEMNEQLVFIYGIVLDHGGEMLTSREQNGLGSMTILLPSIKNTVNMYGDNASDELLKGSETILLVDDEDIIWDVVIDMLQRLGYTVILAANGKECVELYRDNPNMFDLVLLDMVMPEMNGREAYFALQEIDENVKVILQSGYIAQADAQDVLDAGANGFLHKPYRMADLAKKMRSILD